MEKIYFGLFMVIFLCNSSCNRQNSKNVDINPNWTKRNLTSDWTIYLPKNFKDSALIGIDSQPGFIRCESDSILLNFDSGADVILKGKLSGNYCDFSNQIKIAKGEIENDDQDYFRQEDKIYNLKIDTIDKKVAIVRTPILKGKNRVELQIRDCESGRWLSIYGENFSKEKENLVLEIFKTIEFTDR